MTVRAAPSTPRHVSVSDYFAALEGLAANRSLRYIVIGGLPKSGTTLLLTLLDGHSSLSLLPEEFRLFHRHADRRNGDAAARELLSESNLAMLSISSASFDTYRSHRGTGFGVREYDDVDFERFSFLISSAFRRYRSPRLRILSVHLAYEIARAAEPEQDPLRNPRTIHVSKAPHAETYSRNWERAFGAAARYVVMVRDPVELFYTMWSLDQRGDTHYFPAARGDIGHAVTRFVRMYSERMRITSLLPGERRFLVAYDDLIADRPRVLASLAGFIGIESEPATDAPTKNGRPWEGNSARGMRASRVFANPAVARERLPGEIVTQLETGLKREGVTLRANRPELPLRLSASARARVRADVARAELNRRLDIPYPHRRTAGHLAHRFAPRLASVVSRYRHER